MTRLGTTCVGNAYAIEYRLMLYTRLAEYLDKSEVVVTRLAVHAIIIKNCLCVIYSGSSP